jgi:DNA-directed RNA polymerase specialized sigma24 family protein
MLTPTSVFHPETSFPPMTESTHCDQPSFPQNELPIYRDNSLLLALAAEYEAELQRYGLLGPGESLPSNSKNGKTDQKTVQGKSKTLWQRLELARQRGRVIECNRQFLLYPQQPFTLMASECKNTGQAPARRKTANLTVNPQGLAPARQAWQTELQRAYGRKLPSAADLLNPQFDWPGVKAEQQTRLREQQHALFSQALTLATPDELVSLGVWNPADPKDQPPVDRHKLMMALSQSCRPAERPQSSRLLNELWNDFELVRMIDRKACEGFGTWEFFPWWVWERDPQATPQQRVQATKVDPRRKQRVSDVLDDLVGVVTRNARHWGTRMQTSWRGWLIEHATRGSIKEIQKERKHQTRYQTASSLTKTGATEEELEQDVLSQVPGREPVRVADSVWWKAQRALLADLTVDEHNVIALRYFSSRNHREIPRAEVARLLKITASQVEKVEKSAKDKMREAATRLRIDAPQND